MGKIVTPAIRKIYKELIHQVVEDLHKVIFAHMPPDKEDCPNCVWDSVNGKSSGTFDSSFVSPITIFGNVISPSSFTRGRCPVCSGVGYLASPVTRKLKALVKWNPKGSTDEIKATPAGREGEPMVRIKVLRADFNTLVGAEYFTVDGVKCVINKPPTIRGLGVQEELVVAFLLATEVGSDVKR
jgi:hypothetical protein